MGAGAPPPLFPPTQWTLVLSARARPEEGRAALEQLLAPRWRALYLLGRKRGLPPADAEDAVQSFMVRLVEGDLLSRLDPGRGTLRAYLKTAFAHHLASRHEHASAGKRGGDRRPVSLDDVEAQLTADAPSPEALFDRAWALELFEGALADLEREFDGGARAGPFELLRALFRFGASEPYEALAARHGMSVPQLKAFVHRAKGRFRQLMRARVAATVQDPSDGAVEGELAAIAEALRS